MQMPGFVTTMFLLYGASTVRAMRALNALNVLSAPQVRPWLLLPAPRGRSSATRVPQLPGCRTAFGCCSPPPRTLLYHPGAAAPRVPHCLQFCQLYSCTAPSDRADGPG